MRINRLRLIAPLLLIAICTSSCKALNSDNQEKTEENYCTLTSDNAIESEEYQYYRVETLPDGINSGRVSSGRLLSQDNAGNRYIIISIFDLDKPEKLYSEGELANLELGEFFIYDKDISFTIDQIDYVEWHDIYSNNQAYHTRKDGMIIVNDEFRFIHASVDRGFDGIESNSENQDLWMLTTKDYVNRGFYDGILCTNRISRIKLSENCDFYVSDTNSIRLSVSDPSEIKPYLLEHYSDAEESFSCVVEFEIKNGEIIWLAFIVNQKY